MAICSYLVFPAEGEMTALVAQLGALPGCEVVRAQNREILILVTDSPGPVEDAALRARIESLPGIRALILTFGQLNVGPA